MRKRLWNDRKKPCPMMRGKKKMSSRRSPELEKIHKLSLIMGMIKVRHLLILKVTSLGAVRMHIIIRMHNRKSTSLKLRTKTRIINITQSLFHLLQVRSCHLTINRDWGTTYLSLGFTLGWMDGIRKHRKNGRSGAEARQMIGMIYSSNKVCGKRFVSRFSLQYTQNTSKTLKINSNIWWPG